MTLCALREEGEAMTKTRCIITNKSKVPKSVVSGGRTYTFYPGVNKPVYLNSGAVIYCGRHSDLAVKQVGVEVYDEKGVKVRSSAVKTQVTPEDVALSITDEGVSKEGEFGFGAGESLSGGEGLGEEASLGGEDGQYLDAQR